MKNLFGIVLLCFTTILVACNKDDDGIKLNQTSYTMYSDDTSSINATGLPDDAIWSSENEFIATAEGQHISSNKIGYTTLSFDGATISVNVTPRFSLYTEPDMSWGCSMNSLINKLGNPDNSSNNILMYETDNSAAPYEMYMFNESGLSACATLIKLSYGVKLVDFLDERYVFFSVDKEDYTASFAHCYGTKDNPQIDYAGQMAFDSSIGGILVVYAPNTSSNTRGIEITDCIETMAKMMKNN